MVQIYFLRYLCNLFSKFCCDLINSSYLYIKIIYIKVL